MTTRKTGSSSNTRVSFKRAALASVAAAPFCIGLAASPAHAQLVNTATVSGTPDSGVLAPVDAMESVTVAVPIVAVDDSVTGVNGTAGATNVLNVLTDDTLDGNPATTGNVTISEVTPATPASPGDPVPVLNPATGAVDVPAGTPAGTYLITYEICETANVPPAGQPENCDTATATVEVEGATLAPDDDSVTGVNGATGAMGVLDVLDGDTLNGVQTTLAEVDINVLTPATPLNPGDPVPALNPATGLVDVPAGTPAGTYTIVYEICEELNPTNCEEATVTVVVDPSPILPDDDSVSGIDGATGAMGVLDVLDGDLLNGVQTTLADVNINVLTPATPMTPGAPVPTLDPATGLVDVPPGTPLGTYTIVYEICEELNPTNCEEATVTVTVDGASIAPDDDSVTGVNGATGATGVLDVLDGDLLNGMQTTLAEVDISVLTPATPLNPGDPVPTLDPATGLVDVPAGTPAGTYTIVYEICEELNPTNCEEATVTVVVDPSPILPDDDSVTGVNGATGAPGVLDVLDGDLLNGVQTTLADVDINVLTPATPVNPGDPVPVLDPATGLVDVPAGTPAGTYTIVYEICEELNPTNCEEATVTVVVDDSSINPDDDSVTGVNGATGATGVLDVLDGDTLNGVQTTLADVDINVLTPATPVNPGDPVPTLDPATGLVDVPAGTPAGTYTIVYEICEELNPTNCEEATVTVVVDPSPIAPDDDSVTGVNGTEGATGVLDVLDGDLLNGVQTTLADVDINVLTPATPATPGAPVPTLDPATGLVDVPPGTPAGSYTIVYEICEELNPTNCEEATVTIEVEGAPIVADPDEATDINGADGATGVIDVLDGDTLNGDPATLATVDIEVLTPATPVNPGDPVPTLDPATGLIDVPPGTPAGTYEIEYQICEELNPTNCSTNIATIIVDPPAITADPDDVAGVNGADGADNVLDVLDGDTLNGVPATLATVDIEVLTPATPANPGDPVPTLDPATGQISVPPGTPAGTYTIEYQICEELNPTNCATAIATVEVEAAEITADDDVIVGINGADGADDAINAFDNDMLNGMDIDPDDITATVLTPATPVTPGAPVPELDPETGLVDVPPGTPAGTYTIVYEICETLNPTNCAEASITIEVEPPVIEAADDMPEPVRSGIGSDNAINAFDNDTLNGEPVDPADITATVLTPAADPGVVLDPETGIVSVSDDVPAGTYTIVYEICEDLNPTNCSTSTVTVVVEAPISTLEGTVFNDDNGDEDLQQGEDGAPGYIVQVLDENGEVIAETVADADGNYSIEGLPSDTPLTVQFINPENNVVFQTIEDLTLTPNATTSDVNAPIDPSGIIYDSVERTPIAGATLNLVDDMGNPLPDVCYVDASQANQTTGASGEYRFDIIPGAAPQCPLGETEYTISIEPPAGFSGPSTVIPPLEGPFDPTGLTAPVRINPTNDIPMDPTPPYYFDFVLESGDPDVIFNHIPLDPFLSRGELIVTKTSIKRTASVGDVVPYEIVVRNAENAPRADVDVVDILPSGTKYVAGTSLVDGVPTEPVNTGRTLTWEDQIIPANGSVTYNLALIIGAGVTAGEKVNTGLAQNGADGSDISNRGTAVVTIVPSTVFDCSELIGKVFEDRNRNGYQDENEPGVPGVRLATVNGLLVTTDEFGRYHIACAAVPDSRIGSNFVIKLDTRTLPLGWNTTSHNPRSIRLTRGKFGELNFGVAPEETPETRTEGGE